MAAAPSTRVLVGLLAAALAATSVIAIQKPWWPGFVGAAFLSGAVLLVLWRRNALSMRQVLLGAFLFRLLFFWLPPSLSDDAYRYVWDGHLQVEGLNPYRYAPEDQALAALQEEPVFERLNSSSYHSVYPPFSQVVFAAGGLFYEAGWPVSYYVIKGLFVLLELAAVFLLAQLVAARTLMLYAWHPLVLVEVAGQGHTEAAAVFFLVATVWAVRRQKGEWASAALAGAVWTKLYPVVLFPFLWRRFGWRAVWPGALVSAVLLAPYADAQALSGVLDSLRLYVQLFEFNAGPYYAVKELFRAFTGADWSKTLGPAFGVLFALSLPLWYVLDARRRWPLAKAFLVALGAFLACSTTVHPWYLLAVLPLAALSARPSWHWQWLALFSLGTYLLYTGGPYWFFVITGWVGWAALGFAPRLLPLLKRKRSKEKFRQLQGFFPVHPGSLRVLDLGAGEGFVGAEIRRHLGAKVQLADVIDLNRTALPHRTYDGRTLPFEDDAFDVTVLYFVLHHAEEPRRVLKEALRVTRRRVVVVESVYRGAWQRRLLVFLDRWANRLRSGGRMAAQEVHLHHRTAAQWRRLIRELGGEIIEEKHRGRWMHRQAFFVVRPPDAEERDVS